MAVHTIGLREYVGAVRKIDKSLAAEVTVVLRNVAQRVRAKSREIATDKGLEDTGKLINSLGYSVRGGSAYITERATSDRGYPYPAVFEYGKNSPWQESRGDTSFMEPAVREEEPFVTAELEAMLATLAGENGF